MNIERLSIYLGLDFKDLKKKYLFLNFGCIWVLVAA